MNTPNIYQRHNELIEKYKLLDKTQRQLAEIIIALQSDDMGVVIDTQNTLIKFTYSIHDTTYEAETTVKDLAMFMDDGLHVVSIELAE